MINQNITQQKTPGRLTRNNKTPLKPAGQTGSSLPDQARSPLLEIRSGQTGSAGVEAGSPKMFAGSQRAPAGKLQSPAGQKMPSKKPQPTGSEKARHQVESSFVRDFGGDIQLERFNTTESDEDIAKVCGQMEDEVCYCYFCLISDVKITDILLHFCVKFAVIAERAGFRNVLDYT